MKIKHTTDLSLTKHAHSEPNLLLISLRVAGPESPLSDYFCLIKFTCTPSLTIFCLRKASVRAINVRAEIERPAMAAPQLSQIPSQSTSDDET